MHSPIVPLCKAIVSILGTDELMLAISTDLHLPNRRKRLGGNEQKRALFPINAHPTSNGLVFAHMKDLCTYSYVAHD